MNARNITAVVLAVLAGVAMIYLGMSSRPKEPEKVFAAAELPPVWNPEVIEAFERLPLADSDGRVKRESVKVFEIHPGLPGEAGWKRLVSEDGKPIPAGEVREQDRERREQVEEYLQRFARDPQAACEAHRQELDRWRRKRAEMIDEVFRVFDLRIIGREVLDGRHTLVLTLEPRPGARPRFRRL